MLNRLDAYRLRLPLTTPYHLAFGDVEAFDTILVVASDEQGREGYGDATVLTGYTDETIEGSWPLAQQLARRLVGGTLASAKAEALALAAQAPFLATAFASAVEMLEGAPLLRIECDSAVPVLGTINDTEPAAMRAQIDRLCAAGYRTLKIKVGSATPDEDAKRVTAALAHVAGRARLRVDANQGYTPEQAIAFANTVPVDGIELFEQPCAAGDWVAHMAVVRECPLPLMLDESIYDESDIDETASRRARDAAELPTSSLGTSSVLTREAQRAQPQATAGASLARAVMRAALPPWPRKVGRRAERGRLRCYPAWCPGVRRPDLSRGAEYR